MEERRLGRLPHSGQYRTFGKDLNDAPSYSYGTVLLFIPMG